MAENNISNGTQTQYAHKKYLNIFYYIYYNTSVIQVIFCGNPTNSKNIFTICTELNKFNIPSLARKPLLTLLQFAVHNIRKI